MRSVILYTMIRKRITTIWRSSQAQKHVRHCAWRKWGGFRTRRDYPLVYIIMVLVTPCVPIITFKNDICYYTWALPHALLGALCESV
jgi:hypothetical protein